MTATSEDRGLLAELLAAYCSKSSDNMDHFLCGELVHRQHYEEADAILASDWLAARVAEAGARALMDAADNGPSSTPTDALWRMWLRDRARGLGGAS